MELFGMIPIVYIIVLIAVTLFALISLIRKHKSLKSIFALWILIIIAPVVLFFTMPDIFKKMGLGDLLEDSTDPKGVVKEKPKTSTAKKGKVIKRAKKVGTVDSATSKPKPVDQASRQKSIAFVEKARALWKEDNLTDPNLALKMLNQAVSIDPNFAVAFNDRGKVHAKMGQFDRAKKDYDQAIKLDSKYVKAYSNRGVVLYETNQYADALKSFNKAIVLNPSYAAAYLNRGLVNYQMDHTDRACKDFTKACELGDCEGADWAKKKGVCKKVTKN
ncbi:MAG: tetratricopeptide repeat protein [Deltaproteobacteria bacterium]|nr:tetratricopeptide repeat protein [Deltaproteobacteria bacterium]